MKGKNQKNFQQLPALQINEKFSNLYPQKYKGIKS
jgi:hypothetical protein